LVVAKNATKSSLQTPFLRTLPGGQWTRLKSALLVCKEKPVIFDALSCLRGVLWQDRIESMFGKGFLRNKNFEFLIEAFAAAA